MEPTFAVMYFPQAQTKETLGREARQVTAALVAEGLAPHFVSGDLHRVCMLITGSLQAIERGLIAGSPSSTSWLCLQAGTAFSARGLSNTVRFLQRPR